MAWWRTQEQRPWSLATRHEETIVAELVLHRQCCLQTENIPQEGRRKLLTTILDDRDDVSIRRSIFVLCAFVTIARHAANALNQSNKSEQSMLGDFTGFQKIEIISLLAILSLYYTVRLLVNFFAVKRSLRTSSNIDSLRNSAEKLKIEIENYNTKLIKIEELTSMTLRSFEEVSKGVNLMEQRYGSFTKGIEIFEKWEKRLWERKAATHSDGDEPLRRVHREYMQTLAISPANARRLATLLYHFNGDRMHEIEMLSDQLSMVKDQHEIWINSPESRFSLSLDAKAENQEKSERLLWLDRVYITYGFSFLAVLYLFYQISMFYLD